MIMAGWYTTLWSSSNDRLVLFMMVFSGDVSCNSVYVVFAHVLQCYQLHRVNLEHARTPLPYVVK